MHAWALAGLGHRQAVERLLAARPPAELAAEDAGYNWLMAVVGAAVSASTVGDVPWAQAAHDALFPYSGRNCVMGYVAYLGAVDHHLGTLATVLGRHDDAVAHLDAALDRHRTVGARPWVALSAAWAANARGRAGRAGAPTGPRRSTPRRRRSPPSWGCGRCRRPTRRSWIEPRPLLLRRASVAASPALGACGAGPPPRRTAWPQRLKRSRCSLMRGKTSVAASRPISASRWA